MARTLIELAANRHDPSGTSSKTRFTYEPSNDSPGSPAAVTAPMRFAAAASASLQTSRHDESTALCRSEAQSSMSAAKSAGCAFTNNDVPAFVSRVCSGSTTICVAPEASSRCAHCVAFFDMG